MIPIFLLHRIKIIHICFYPVLSWFQFYSPHNLSFTKFLSPPGIRDLPSGPPGAQPRESLRSAPSPAAARGGLPSSRPPDWCLGLRALPGREPAPRRTRGTSGASGRPGGRGPPGAVCAARLEPPSGRREPVPSWGTLATPAKGYGSATKPGAELQRPG